MDNEQLKHHGVKGQKWGVRRYQNKDGTLTSEGKKHYGKGGDAKSKSAAELEREHSRAFDARWNMQKALTDKAAADPNDPLRERVYKSLKEDLNDEPDYTLDDVRTFTGYDALDYIERWSGQAECLTPAEYFPIAKKVYGEEWAKLYEEEDKTREAYKAARLAERSATHSDSTEEVIHWGIKGMRWGVRRYQNPDGSLTPAGKKRYAKDIATLKEENAKLDAQIKAKKAADRTKARVEKLLADNEAKKKALRGEGDDAAKKTTAKADGDQKTETPKKERPVAKTAAEMTTQELQERVNRIRLEQEYARLNPEKVSLGKRFTSYVFKNVVTPAATEVAQKALKNYLSTEIEALRTKQVPKDKPKKDKK